MVVVTEVLRQEENGREREEGHAEKEEKALRDESKIRFKITEKYRKPGLEFRWTITGVDLCTGAQQAQILTLLPVNVLNARCQVSFVHLANDPGHSRATRLRI